LEGIILIKKDIMIYITQLIFVKPGKECVFNEFEDLAIPLLEKYNGKLLYRIRPTIETIISSEEEHPYEVHFITFDSELDLKEFMNDDSRLKFMHLKEDSIKSTVTVKGIKM